MKSEPAKKLAGLVKFLAASRKREGCPAVQAVDMSIDKSRGLFYIANPDENAVRNIAG